jgi:hypothetical protein
MVAVLETTQALILESCKERDGRTNVRAVNVWLVALEEAGAAIIDDMLQAGLQGFEWWLLYQMVCGKDATRFVGMVQDGTARAMLAKLPVLMDTEPDNR